MRLYFLLVQVHRLMKEQHKMYILDIKRENKF